MKSCWLIARASLATAHLQDVRDRGIKLPDPDTDLVLFGKDASPGDGYGESAEFR